VLDDATFEAVYLPDTIAEFARRMKKDYGPLLKILDAVLFFQSGGIHKRNRRALTQVFNRVPLSTLEPTIKEIAVALAAVLRRRTEYDPAAEYADLIPSRVMIHILGLPSSDLPLLLDLAADFTRTFDTIPISLYETFNLKAITALEHLSSRIQQAVDEERDNGLTLLARATKADDGEFIEAAALAFFVFAVGTETTAALIAACIDGLLRHPQLYAKAREAPGAAARIVAEIVRLESPVQRVARIAPRDLVLGNRQIKQGDRVMLLLGAANRDPHQFSCPSQLDLEREQKPDVGFGAGGHSCLGTSLARMEARIAVEEFLRLPPIELCGSVTRYKNKTIRKIAKLPVRVVTVPDHVHAE
jgi:cytochrome P450